MDINSETMWESLSNRKRVKTLLAMRFIPTWLEEVLDYADLVFLQAQIYTERALKAEEKLRKIKEIYDKYENPNLEPSEIFFDLEEVFDS